MTFAITPGPLARAFELAWRRLEESRFAEALWTRRLDVWTGDAAVQHSIGNRLGWLDVVAAMQRDLPRLQAVAESMQGNTFTDVVLLGMGGSSLAPEVLRSVIATGPGYPRFQVLDSIDPDAVRPALAQAPTTLFVLASKSGSTIEMNTLAAEAERRLRDAGVEPGSHCIAITDEDTPLHRRAIEQRFRDLFINPADIGGRFSALSFFGLVPAALMGIDPAPLLARAQAMAELCRDPDPQRNPGLALGAAMAAAAAGGRDKLTLIVPDRLSRFTLWIEQLVAESTGKQGKGILPVAGEPPRLQHGADRLVVSIEFGDRGDIVPGQDVPTVTLHLPDMASLGAEFFRWEVATAAAGFLLDVNPFDEPNVQQAKDATRALLDGYRATERLPLPEPDASINGARVFVTGAARAIANGRMPPPMTELLRPGDYMALLAYLPDRDPCAAALERLRSAVTDASGCAATLGYGPRYLHSTGQLHKGGPDRGVFLIVTATPTEDLPVPGEPYSFGVLEMAQAAGDFQSLDKAGRRAVHIHLPARDPELLERIGSMCLRRTP